jgi:hypothetical protein
VLLAATTAPVLAGAVLVSATFGPAGAVAYAALLTAGVNTPRLFRNRQDHR